MNNKYDVIIVGGGITGSAVLYVLSNYTDIPKIALLEKYGQPALINTAAINNSQTLHFGDIETHYTAEKSAKVKEAAEMAAKYLENHKSEEGLFIKSHKMVLAVGEKEVGDLENHFVEIRELFPELRKINKDEIGQIEPFVVKGRDLKIKLSALLSPNGYAVNFQKLAELFIKEACLAKNKQVDIFYNTKLIKIEKNKTGYEIKTAKGIFKADAVVVAAGPHSLIYAHQFGLGKEYGILPVAGNFYAARNVLRGKVYMMQIKKMPFAAFHGDPNVLDLQETRFGPTVRVLPLLERHNYATVLDFLKTSVWNFRGVASLIKIISDYTVFRYVLKNILFDIPLIGKLFVLKDVRKIAPSLEYSNFKMIKKAGGIRPQMVNVKTKRMEMGEAEFVGENIIFNITPSPGASVCLKNAENEAKLIIEFFNGKYKFDEEKFNRDFK